jgi:hypothetical protein
MEKSQITYKKKLFTLNCVINDNHDRYKTVNIEINELFGTLDKVLIFSNLILLVEYILLSALNRIRFPASTFALVNSFIHLNVRTDDIVYNCKTAAISFIHLSPDSMISKILNVIIRLKS